MSASRIELRWIDHESEEFPDWVDLRQRILRDPIGLQFSQEDFEVEKSQLHLIAKGDSLVGGLVLAPLDDRVGKIRQVAVDETFQGAGIGRLLMAEAENRARAIGLSEIVLHSRANVCGFYEKLEYAPEGGIFEEVGIPHRKMRKILE